MTQPPPGYYQPAQVSTACTWHPDRATALSCSRCGRPACPECLTPASVGFHCRQCVAEGRSAVPVARTISGGIHGQQPVVSFVLIGINVLLFLITMVQGGGESGIDRSELFNAGALDPEAVADGSWWQLIRHFQLDPAGAPTLVGLVSQSPTGSGCTSHFDQVTFIPEPLADLRDGS